MCIGERVSRLAGKILRKTFPEDPERVTDDVFEDLVFGRRPRFRDIFPLVLFPKARSEKFANADPHDAKVDEVHGFVHVVLNLYNVTMRNMIN
jgi:hypothetical protein